MGGWRSKFTFLLIVYFAGFATAIYCLAPVSDKQACLPSDRGFPYSAVKSDEFAKSFNVKMHEYLYYGKDAAQHASAYLKQKLDDRHS